MGKFTLYIAALILSIQVVRAQTNKNIGVGYFGNTITYPGLVAEFELEKMFTEKTSLPLRMDVGFYHHKRYNTGIFADLNYGFRRYYESGIFLEESIGFGLISTFLSSDNVYSYNEESSTFEESSRYATTDLMPSITLGAGYNLSKNQEVKQLIWIRPKLFWQFPHKTTSFYSIALQVGYSGSW